jgi:LuxR family maltose regulon positive regulatory protein
VITPVESISAPLIKTKLSIPQLCGCLVDRPHLLVHLGNSDLRALTLVCAPAGYGKTTLLINWIANLKKTSEPGNPLICWVSLDVADNEPIRFLSYLVAAIGTADADISAEAQSMLQLNTPPPLQTILAILINELEKLATSIYLVLDDYQFISNKAIHEGMAFFIDHLPANSHLVIATRSDPPIPLARLRARGQMAEIRAVDLRFSYEETVCFFNQIMELGLTPEDITRLNERTEGWIASLQMAAISMRDREDVRGFVEGFSGTNRYILDYLLEEVLASQPPEIQHFLLYTSILERLSAPLCEAVLEVVKLEDLNNYKLAATFQPSNLPYCQQILEYLERANLFLVPLDEERQWYRYHHLFGELLQARLQPTAPELIPYINAQASAWYEHHGWIDEAVNHSLKAKDWEGTARLVEQNIIAFLSRGQLATVMKWIDVLPKELILHHPMLCIRIASALTQAGRWYETDTFLEIAEQAIENWKNHPVDSNSKNADGLTPSKIQWIRNEIAYGRAMSMIYSGNPSGALAPIQSTLMDRTDISPDRLAWLHWAEGMAYRELGELEPALRSFSEAIRISSASGNVWWDFWADYAFTTHMAGKLSRAGELLHEALRLAAEHQSVYQGNLGRVESYLSSVYLEQNKLEEALEHARRAVEFIQGWPSQNSVPTTYAFLALIYLAIGDLDLALSTVQHADQERRNGIFLQFTQCLVDVALSRVWLVKGDHASLEQWTSGMTSSLALIEEDSAQIDRYQEVRLTTLARIWLETAEAEKSMDRLEKTISLLGRLEKIARTKVHGNTLIEVLTLKVIALQVRGSAAAALTTLEECLGLAETEGYIRVFVDAGEIMRELLTTYLCTPDLLHKAYAQRLLDVFGDSSRSTPTADSKAGLAEPLTARELEVLHLISLGKTNQEIARQLIVAPGTVKAHTASIYRKLDVANRTEAAARARQIGILPGFIADNSTDIR